MVGPGKRGIAAVEEGNWGGKFVKKTDTFYVDEEPAKSTVGIYLTEMNEDFAERIRWSEE